MDQNWLMAIGLVLLIEGLLPFAAPRQWRDAMVRVSQLRDGQIRFIGLGALLLGVLLVML